MSFPTQAEQEAAAYLAERQALERRRQVRGLLLLAAVVLALSLWRAGLDNVFPQRWWHPW